MKKLLSLILTAAMLTALGIPAAAEASSADQRLAQVTAKVKSTLGIGDEYEEFYGEMWENELSPTWSLNWSREADSLTVEATGSGKVLSYSWWESDGTAVNPGRGSFPPSFPAVTREAARQTAEAFVKKVLDSSQESAVFVESSGERLDTSSYRFRGEIYLNGVPSPLSFSVTVRSSDGKVTRFYRDSLEGSTIGGVPSAKPAAARGTAGSLLKGTLALRLEYVLTEDGSRAQLRYLPEPGDEFYVDAQTGKLVNLTELYQKAEEQGYNTSAGASADMAAPAAEAANSGGGLSRVEQEGIAKLEGVLSKEDLDRTLREMAALGLGKYTLGSASYSVDRETGDVTAQVVYSRRDSDGTWRRTVTCDGKSGELLAVSSSAPYAQNRQAAVDAEKARKSAEEFLTGLWGDEFGRTALYSSTPWSGGSWGVSHGFTYAQQENGYFCPENQIWAAVDITDGSISGLSRSWTDAVFDSPEGILDEAAALDAWFNHYKVKLGYLNVPVKLDPGTDRAAPLLEMGYSYFYGLKLAYALEEDARASGLDARTGEIIRYDSARDQGVAYTDLEGHWARAQLETLAQYGIGWAGDSCQPARELTQIDLVALLVSADGWRFNPETDDADSLYSRAYSLGILTRADRQDSKTVTRGEVVRLLLDGGGYGSVAKIPGIFTCSFADRASIPADLLGYAALAQGLGIVSGDGAGGFAADRTVTRAEAAVMLYNFMKR